VVRGWHKDSLNRPKPADVPKCLALIHSEISEALEGHRKNLPDLHLQQFKSIEVELADALHRIFDLAGACDLHLAEAYVNKAIYNLTRVDWDKPIGEGGRLY